MNMGGFFAGIFWLILAYLVFTNWKGANALMGTGGSVGISGIKALQGR